MIYLIGGSPRVGKSIIASKLSKSIGAKLVSTDDLKVPQHNLPGICFSGDPKENVMTPKERVNLKAAVGLRVVVANC